MSTSTPSFTIVKHPVKQTNSKPAEPNPINHIAVIDVSGSMSSDLPRIRSALKNKVLNLVKEKDTLSIVWFSGKGQFGTLLEAFNINTLQDLKAVHAAIDTSLRPVGLTGFVEPLQEVVSLVGRVSANRPNTDFAMFFMTDGQDNCWDNAKILQAAQDAGAVVASTTYVEYGWGCNRTLLAKMAEKAGGELLFSDGFDDYEVNLAKTIQFGKTLGSKKVSVQLKNNLTQDYAFAIVDGSIMTFAIESNPQLESDKGVTVPADLVEFYTFEKKVTYEQNEAVTSEPVLAALYTLAQRMTDTDAIFELLERFGDVYLHRVFSNCFSKQDYIRFQEAVHAAIFDNSARFLEGHSDDLKVDPDAFCVLDLLDLLSSNQANLVYPKHESFAYKKTTAFTVQKDSIITTDELAELQAQLATAKPEDLTRIMAEIKALQDSKVALKFEYNDLEKGYPINGLVWNEDRPNVSVRFLYDGFIRLPDSRPQDLPALINTQIWRNYTVILDGIVHLNVLPVSLSADTFMKLQMNGFFPGESYLGEKNIYILDFAHLPVINRRMVTDISGKELCELSWQLENLKGRAKVYKDLFKEQGFEKPQPGLASKYSPESVEWLKGYGIADNGFSPPSVKSEDVDQYMAKSCEVSIASLSSLAKTSEVVEKLRKIEEALAEKKPTPNWLLKEVVMLPAYMDWLNFKELPADQKWDESAFKEQAETWLTEKKTELIKTTRILQVALARIKFAVVVGHAWFKDIPFDNPVLELPMHNIEKPVKFTIKLYDKSIGKAD
jgi:hypothetical protein